MVVGGGLIFVTGVGGFVSGVIVDQWLTNGDRVPKPGSSYGQVGQVSYQGRPRRSKPETAKATTTHPATGTSLPFDRIVEINNSTVENPVELTLEEAYEMHLNHVLLNIQTGRFKLEMQ